MKDLVIKCQKECLQTIKTATKSQKGCYRLIITKCQKDCLQTTKNQRSEGVKDIPSNVRKNVCRLERQRPLFKCQKDCLQLRRETATKSEGVLQTYAECQREYCRFFLLERR